MHVRIAGEEWGVLGCTEGWHTKTSTCGVQGSREGRGAVKGVVEACETLSHVTQAHTHTCDRQTVSLTLRHM